MCRTNHHGSNITQRYFISASVTSNEITLSGVSSHFYCPVVISCITKQDICRLWMHPNGTHWLVPSQEHRKDLEKGRQYFPLVILLKLTVWKLKPWGRGILDFFSPFIKGHEIVCKGASAGEKRTQLPVTLIHSHTVDLTGQIWMLMCLEMWMLSINTALLSMEYASQSASHVHLNM